MRKNERKCFERVVQALLASDPEFKELATGCSQFVSLYTNMLLEKRVNPNRNGMKKALVCYQRIVGRVKKQASHLAGLASSESETALFELECIQDICKRRKRRLDKKNLHEFLERKMKQGFE